MSLNIEATVIVVATVLIIFWLDRQPVRWLQQVLNWFPSILFAYLIPALFTHGLQLDLSSVYLHALSRNWIIPFTIFMVMSSLSIARLMKVGIKPLLLFLSGSLVIAILPVFILWITHTISPTNEWIVAKEYWPGIVPIVGSWIGGSVSQLVLKEVVGCPETLFLSVIVLDNILVNCWTILMFQVIKRSERINKLFYINAPLEDTEQIQIEERKTYHPFVVFIVSLAIIVAINFFVEDFLLRVIIFSIAGLVVANVLPKWNHRYVLKAGGILILIIMSILGLRLNFGGLSLPASFVLLCLIWLTGHYIFMMIIAKVLNLHMAWVPIASMANLGGISTAPAVTSAYNKSLMPHAILLAILSMVTGNLWGMFTYFLLNRL